MLCARKALERPKYQKEFIPSYDPHLPSPYHVRLVMGHGGDGLPLNHQADAYESSFACSNVKSSNAPELQYNDSFVKGKETSVEVAEICARHDLAHKKALASSPSASDGIELVITPPTGARWCPRSHWGIKSPYYLHLSYGWLEHDDSKMFSFLYFGHTSAQTIQTGGMFYDVSKASLLRPLAAIIYASGNTPGSSPESSPPAVPAVHDRDRDELLLGRGPRRCIRETSAL